MNSVLCAYIAIWDARLQEAENQNLPEDQLRLIRFAAQSVRSDFDFLSISDKS